jgi:restriction system protein
MARSTTPPMFARFLAPIIDTLRARGNVAASRDVLAEVIERSGLTPEEVEATTPAGQSRVRNQIHWARFYLVRAGVLDTTARGVWRLTDAAASIDINSPEVVRALLRAVRSTKSDSISNVLQELGARRPTRPAQRTEPSEDVVALRAALTQR